MRTIAADASWLSGALEARDRSERHGRGVFALRRVEAGECLAVWGGRVVAREALDGLSSEARSLTLQVEEGLYLAPAGPPDPADLVNHSCDPNAGLCGQITLVAMRPIERGEEVCFDYAMSEGSSYDDFPCSCGSDRCRGRVTGSDWRRPELWERYGGFFSPYLARRIAALRGTG